MILVSILLKVLVVLLCILLTLLIALMIIPFEYNLKLQVNENMSFEAKLLWLFHLIKVSFLKENSSFRINFFIVNRRVFSVNSSKKSKANEKEKRRKKESSKNFFKKDFLTYAIYYFKDILKIIKPKMVEIKGIYGFYDPSITGILSGLISIIEQSIPNSSIKIQPIFDDEIVDVEANIWGKVILFSIIYRTLRFILKKEVRRVLFKKSKAVET